MINRLDPLINEMHMGKTTTSSCEDIRQVRTCGFLSGVLHLSKGSAQPVRVAMTCGTGSRGLYDVLEVRGKEKAPEETGKRNPQHHVSLITRRFR